MEKVAVMLLRNTQNTFRKYSAIQNTHKNQRFEHNLKELKAVLN